MVYSFDYLSHGDLALNEGGEWYNLGPHYNLKLPVMLWLANLQTEQVNLFEKFSAPKQDLPAKINTVNLEDALELARTLPLSPEEFNMKVLVVSFSHFNNGPNNIFYEFRLTEDKTLQLKRTFRDKNGEETVLKLRPEDCRILAKEYIQFVRNGKEIPGILRMDVAPLVYTLGQFSKNP